MTVSSQAGPSNNRRKLDEAMINLAEELSILVVAMASSASQAGLWSLDNLSPEFRKDIRSLDNISRSKDLSLLLGIVLDSWVELKFEEVFEKNGVSRRLVDKVRHIRNEFAHNSKDYSDDGYVTDCLKAITDFLGGIHSLYNAAGTTGSALSPSAPKLQNAEAYAQQGQDFLDAGAYDQVIISCSMAISLSPYATSAFLNRGIAYRNQGDHYHAIEDFSRAISIKPQDLQAYNERGLVYLNNGEIEKALKDFDHGISLDPTYVYLWNNRGVAYERVKQIDQAFHNYNRATVVDPGFALAWTNLGNLHINAGQPDLAIDVYNRAISSDPNMAIAWNGRGWVYLLKKKYGNAIGDFRRAIEIVPNHSYAVPNLKVTRSRRMWRRIRWGVFAIALLYVAVWVLTSIASQ